MTTATETNVPSTPEQLVQLCQTHDAVHVRQAVWKLICQAQQDDSSSTKDTSTNHHHHQLITQALEQFKDNNEHLQTLLLHAWVDALWLLSSTTTDDATTSSTSTTVQTILQDDTHFLTRHPLARSYALQTLPLSAATNDKTDELIWKKVRLYNTQHFYKQQKFNLLAEESQGYAKLLTLLTSLLTTSEPSETSTSTSNSTDMTQQVRNVMATFSLDPNRVLDLTLFCLLQQFKDSADDSTATSTASVTTNTLHHHQDTWLELLRDMTPTPQLPKLLSFALTNQQQQQSQNDNSNRHFYQCLTWLVQHQILDLHDMWSFLWGPTQIQALQDNDAQALQQTPAIHWLHELLKSSSSTNSNSSAVVVEWMDLMESPHQDWPRLFQLIPSLGTALCQRIQTQVLECLPDPWNNNSHDGTTVTIPQHFQEAVWTQLSLVAGLPCLSQVLYTQVCRLLVRLEHAPRDFIRKFVLPSLLLFPGSPAVSHVAWQVLEPLPYQERYELYQDWSKYTTGKTQALKDCRYCLKRLSKDTIHDMSRGLAKVCYSHPLTVFTTILNQIEAYDNMVQVVVDSLRFVTPLALDVLGFCLMKRLTSNDRSRLKADGTNVSQWLQSIESFVGAFYKSHPLVEFQGILSYLMQRLVDGQVLELGVLRQILKTSAGWAFGDYAPAASLAATQLQGRAGSFRLQRETMSFGIVDDVNWRASQQVRNVLQVPGVSLLILLSQVRQRIVFSQDDKGRPKPVKLIGNLLDTCQVTLSILLNFLTHEEAPQALEKYNQSLPSLNELCDEYQLDVASAWMLCRPLKEQREYTELPAVPHLTTCLFRAFYSHALKDLMCPSDLYTVEVSRLEKEKERLEKEGKKGEEFERVKRTVVDLKKDLEKQSKHVDNVKEDLEDVKKDMFREDDADSDTVAAFMTRCVYPRCMQGPDDAMYCAKFILRLHEMETPGFRTLQFLDCMIVALSRCLFSLTEGEAANVSLLLLETWKVVSRWRYDADAFAAEVEGKPGAALVAEDETTEGRPASANDFESLYNKWHAAIGAACLGCLESQEYMHKRCCLIVLGRMVDVYPTRPRLGNRLLQKLEVLQNRSSTLQDIRAAAQAYSMQLVKARDDGVWKEEDAATVQARLKKERAAVEARQKKAERQMEEMKRDSEKITEEIGEWRGRGNESRGRAPARAFADNSPNRGRPRDGDRGRGDMDRGRPAVRPAGGSYSSMSRRPESLEGRWQRPGDGNAGGGMKRSRPPSPVDGDSGPAAKRTRTQTLEPGEEAAPDRRRGGRRKDYKRALLWSMVILELFNTWTSKGASSVVFDTVEGEEYKLYVGDRYGRLDGAFGLNATAFVPPSNDKCQDAAPLPTDGVEVVGSTVNATVTSTMDSVVSFARNPTAPNTRLTFVVVKFVIGIYNDATCFSDERLLDLDGSGVANDNDEECMETQYGASTVSLDSVVGVTYKFYVGDRYGRLDGTFGLKVTSA